MTSKSTSRKMNYVGVDVGGSKVGVMVVDSDNHVLARMYSNTDIATPESTLECIVGTVKLSLGAASLSIGDVASVGLGVPGRVDPYSGVVRLAVNLNWRELPAGSLLSSQLGVPCILENDVRVATVGLQYLNGPKTSPNMAYVSIGTGISAGIILNEHLYTGIRGMAGEIGHISLNPDGPRCRCGGNGCLEVYAAGPAIARMAQEAVASGVRTQLRDFHTLTAESVFLAAQQGDVTAREIATRAGRALAYALQALIMTYDVEKIVLGGGVSRAGQAFLQPVLEEIESLRRQSDLAREMLLPGMFQLLSPEVDAGLWGAIVLAQNGFVRQRYSEKEEVKDDKKD